MGRIMRDIDRKNRNPKWRCCFDVTLWHTSQSIDRSIWMRCEVLIGEGSRNFHILYNCFESRESLFYGFQNGIGYLFFEGSILFSAFFPGKVFPFFKEGIVRECDHICSMVLGFEMVPERESRDNQRDIL